MVDRNAATAAKARATGNEFYKLGQFAKAEKAYQIAASLAPQDPAPVSNLSAVKYEIGDYNGSITHIKQALALGAAGTEDSAKTDKLNARLAKCFLHLRDFGPAKDAISSIGNQDLAAELAESLESVLALQADAPEESILRRQILDHVPQYKSWLANVVEYYPYGHDQVEMFMEPIGIDATTNKVQDVSLQQFTCVGYPAHWLLRVFSQICSGTLTTTARPPTERVTNPAAADAKHHPKEISVGPWVDEFTTLLSIWRALIPFGVDSLGGALVPLTGINQYSIDFPPFRAEHERLPHFILLFWNTEIGYTLKPPGSIRYVLSGAYDGTSTHALSRELLNKAIVCVTAFQYLAGSRTADFSMRADKMEKMKTGKWRAFIWRTDAWEAVTDGVDVSAEVVTRKNWAAMA